LAAAPFLLVVTAGIILFGFSFGSFLAPEVMRTGVEANQWLMLTFLSIGMALMGLTFGPMSALLPELFPTNRRYSGSGVAYNFSSILGAALTPFVAAWLARDHGAGAVGFYLVMLASMTFIALLLSRETQHRDLHTMEDDTARAGIKYTSP
jgi:MFS family permease